MQRGCTYQVDLCGMLHDRAIHLLSKGHVVQFVGFGFLRSDH